MNAPITGQAFSILNPFSHVYSQQPGLRLEKEIQFNDVPLKMFPNLHWLNILSPLPMVGKDHLVIRTWDNPLVSFLCSHRLAKLQPFSTPLPLHSCSSCSHPTQVLTHASQPRECLKPRYSLGTCLLFISQVKCSHLQVSSTLSRPDSSLEQFCKW